MGRSLERTTLLAFVGIVVLGGVNGTAIRVGNAELAPFWGAALRFGLASIILFALVGARRVSLPRGRALLGGAIYGLLSFGITFALVNWGLVEAPAGMAQVVLALVPLLTLLLAVTQRIERFRLQSVAGALISVVGVAIIFGERLAGAVPLASMLAILVAAVSISEANVFVKRLPRTHPLANNAIGMGVGAVILVALAFVAGEPLVVPAALPTVLSLGYLVLIGSVVVFTLYLVVIERWTASATSYALLLMPLVSVVVAAVVLNEPITPLLVAGGGLVLGGVYVGAFNPSVSWPLPGLRRRPGAAGEAVPGPPSLASPGCP